MMVDATSIQTQQSAGFRRGGAVWAPPTGTDVWWRATADVAGGNNWVDEIGGKNIPVAADCSVIAGTGLVAPVGHTTLMTSDYTPTAGGGAGRGYSVAFWLWITATSGNIQIISAGSNTQHIRANVTPNRVIPITVYGTVTVIEITTDYTGGEGLWWHLAVTQYWGDDGAQTNKHAEFYVNGVFKSNLTVGTRTDAAQPLSVMAVDFAGKLDDIIAAPRHMTAGEVADIHDNSPESHA